MQYIHIETGKIREFLSGQPIPVEYVRLDPTLKVGPMKGKQHKEETKKIIGQKNKEKMTGKHWFNNGVENIMAFKCPPGFKEGRLNKTK